MNIITQLGASLVLAPLPHVPPIAKTSASQNCEAIIASKFFAQAYQDFRDVVENMGGNPNQVVVDFEFLTPYDAEPNASISPPYKLSINPALLYILNGCDVSYKRQMALGILAHEAAHRVLKHMERSPVELERLTSKEKFIELQRSYEKEADLLTMRVPLYARGVKDYVCKKLPFLQDHALVDPNSPPGKDGTHPSDWNRCRYMTDALCDRHPEKNQDICSYRLVNRTVIGNE